MAAKIRFEIQASNIGPHTNLNASFETGSLQLGLFANNGSGKTFLSRIFRFITNANISPKDANKLLTLNQSQGSFEFKIKDVDKNSIVSSFDISLKRNSLPVINYDRKYIFHVFNDDYIKENLEELRYRPNGNIEGYILGKEKIDLSKEKGDLEQLDIELEKKDKHVLASIFSAKKDLESLGIRSQIKEFSLLNYDNIINKNKEKVAVEPFSDLKNKLSVIKSTPDNLVDLENANISINSNVIFDIQNYLEAAFSRSTIAEDFKSKIRTKQNFIEEGLLILNNNSSICPFCEEKIIDRSLELIDHYNKYLSDSEAVKVKEADSLINFLDRLEIDLERLYTNYIKLKEKYLQYKDYLPTVTDDLDDINFPENLSNNISNLKALLSKKKSDVSQRFYQSDFGDHIDYISNHMASCVKSININKSLIEAINKRKNNLQNEKLELCRKLIISRSNSLKDEFAILSYEIEKNRNDIELLSQDIKAKEENEKIDKKLKVIEFFKYYLGIFFKNKYSFDEDSFCIKFQNNILSDNATDVLSEGEKSIVAFCYYLADVHRVVNQKGDYEKLFFIIDDPISSLDFHYVYAVAQIIRSIGKTLEIQRVRFLVLTHNLEFMSILIRNRIINHRYVLSSGKIETLRRELVMPYEEHLRDVHDVSTGLKEPSHTTPNSIRHILETINRFIAPNLELQAFCESITHFDECEFLYSLIQDNSHGSIRIQKAYTNESIIDGCKTVIYYIGMTFKGQLNNLN
jgi:ABC-type cobalamin/Fe3+-siderophores transport system ATPase subunit